MSISEVVIYTKRSISSLYRDMKQGILQKASRFGNRVFWKKQLIDNYIMKSLNKGDNNDLENE